MLFKPNFDLHLRTAPKAWIGFPNQRQIANVLAEGHAEHNTLRI